jgi:hypothetical protein
MKPLHDRGIVRPMSRFEDDDETDDLREDEDPDESDMNEDDGAEVEVDWSDAPVRSRSIWLTLGLIAIVAFLIWVLITRQNG